MAAREGMPTLAPPATDRAGALELCAGLAYGKWTRSCGAAAAGEEEEEAEAPPRYEDHGFDWRVDGGGDGDGDV